MIIICDIDGTIAEKGDRYIFDYNKVLDDKPIVPTINLLKSLMFSNNNIENVDCRADYVYFVSGREDNCRDSTVAWLIQHDIYVQDYMDLYMRKAGDYRDDTIIKREIYEQHIKPNLNGESVIVFDDRPKVIRMWRELGLFVFNCAQHDKEF